MRSRPKRLVAPLLLAGLLGACTETPTGPSSTGEGLLVLSYAATCHLESHATVFVDGVAVGLVRLPGSLSIPVAPGSHTFAAGTSPPYRFEMPETGNVNFTNTPSPCP